MPAFIAATIFRLQIASRAAAFSYLRPFKFSAAVAQSQVRSIPTSFFSPKTFVRSISNRLDISRIEEKERGMEKLVLLAIPLVVIGFWSGIGALIYSCI
jgi:hypothetical protein